jgi:hypothetical protein
MSRDERCGPWIRSKGQATAIWISLILPVFTLLLGLGLLIGDFPRRPEWAVRLLGLAGVWSACAFGFVSVRKAKAGVRACADGLHVRNPFRSRMIPWARIVTIDLGRDGMYPYVGRVHLDDGSVVRIFGIQAPNIAPNNRRTAALIEALNDEVAKHRR